MRKALPRQLHRRKVEADEDELTGVFSGVVQHAFDLRQHLRAAFDLDEQTLAVRHGGQHLFERRDSLAFPLRALPRPGIQRAQRFQGLRAHLPTHACGAPRGAVVDCDDSAVLREADVQFACVGFLFLPELK